jgi:hypothetical protein
MTKVVLDAELREKLKGGQGGVELTDDQGNVVGHYIPDRAFSRIFELIQPPLTQQEVADARREMLEQGGVSTADILDAIDSAQRDWIARQ